jgi:hypothetical protein
MTGWQEVLLALGSLVLFTLLVFLAAGAAIGFLRSDRDRPRRSRRPRRRD